MKNNVAQLIFPDDPTQYPFGVVYCPFTKSGDLPMREWEEDVKNMRRLNVNLIRCFIAWDRIEQREGVYTFEKQDYLFDLAQRYGLKIALTLNTFDGYGGIYSPFWLRHYECQSVVPASGNQMAPGAMRKYCIDDPIYREKAMGFLGRVVARYCEHEALGFWNLSNEPFMQEGTCYCKHTRDHFAQWLKEKYDGDINLLNQAWSTEFTVAYDAWEQVEPPAKIISPFISDSFTHRLDWYRFHEDNLAGQIRSLRDLVRSTDPHDHFVTANIAYLNANSSYGNHKFCDIWKINAVLDLPAYSHYTLDINEPAYGRASRLARIRSSSRATGKPFLVLETEAEPSKGLDERENTMWQAVAQGAESLMFWKYRGRITDTQTDSFNLVGWDGGLTVRAQHAGRVAGKLQELAPRLQGYYHKADVAIFTSSEGMKLSLVRSEYDLWKSAWLGAYKVFWDLKIPTDYVSDDNILADDLHRYQVLAMPHAMNITDAVARKIMDYVDAGGIVIADGATGLFDDNGSIHTKSPGCGLTELFGGSYNDAVRVEPDDQMTFTINGQNSLVMQPHLFRYALSPGRQAQVIASFQDSDAAIYNRYGNGHAVFIGTCLFSSAISGAKNAPATKVVSDLLDHWGVVRRYKVHSDDPSFCLEDIEVSQRMNNKGKVMLFVLNHSDKVQCVKITSPNWPEGIQIQELFKGDSSESSDNAMSITLQPFGVKLYSWDCSHKKVLLGT